MSKILRYFGAVKETAFNSATPPTPKFHVDIASSSLDIPASKNTIVNGGIGRSASKKVPTFVYPTGDVQHPLDINTIGFWLDVALGGYVFTDNMTTGGSFNLHEFYGSDDAIPKSIACFVGKDQFEHVFTGCAVESIQINIADSVVMATVNIVGAEGKRQAIKLEEDLLLPDLYPVAMHEVTAKINGNIDISAKVQNLTITISNGASADAGKSLGSLHPQRILFGERTVDVSYTLHFEDTIELARYENDEDFSLDINFVTATSGDMNIHLPKVFYDGVPTTVSGRDAITQSATVKVLEGAITLADGMTSKKTDVYVKLNNKEGSY